MLFILLVLVRGAYPLINHWFGFIPSYVCIAATASVVFLGIYLQVSAKAFRRNYIANWLEEHPRGKEIFEEFSYHGAEE